jgi:hypothetical protein
MPRYEPTILTKLTLRDLPDGQNEAFEVPTGPDTWSRLADSYKEAADRLVEITKDSFTYAMHGPPVLFMYRHYIELRLKSLLLDAGELLDEPQDVPPLHYIRTLWQRVRKLLLRISPESDGAWFKRADQVIHDFDSLDPTSFAFRYPVGKTGEPSLPLDLLIDLRVARQMIGELDILLSGAEAQISEYMGYKHEKY